MFLPTRTKGFFIEVNPYAVTLARTSAPAGPMVVEMVLECPAGDSEAFQKAIDELQPKKTATGFLHAVCGIYPGNRIVQQVSLDMKRLKEPGYFADVITQHLHADPEKYAFHVLSAADGAEFPVGKQTMQKEALFAGLPNDEVSASQDLLVGHGLYPERLELGSVALLGGLVDLIAFNKMESPTLVLELGVEATHVFIVTRSGVVDSRSIQHGLDGMIPVVQQELGLQDIEAARNLFYSDTFDFTGMGPKLVRKLLKEMQAAIGFYEVQTGSSVGQIVSPMLPQKLNWLSESITNGLMLPQWRLDTVPWLESRGITLSPEVQNALSARWFGLFCLMVNHKPAEQPAPPPHGATDKKN